MADIKFKSAAHRDFFLENMMKSRVNDCYHRAFFYVMGIASETRADKRNGQGLPPCFQSLERICGGRTGTVFHARGIILLRVCPVFYGGH